MSRRDDADVPFLMDDDDFESEDSGVFSSAPAAASRLDEEHKEEAGVFSSAPPASVSGAFAAVSAPTNRPVTGGFAPVVRPANTTAQLHSVKPPAAASQSGQIRIGGSPRTKRPTLCLLDSSGSITAQIPVSAPRFIIGKEHADLPLQDPFVSKWHAAVSFRNNTWNIEDMVSQNGVYLRIADEFVLEDGDELSMGSQHFVFRSTTPPPKEREGFEPGVRVQGSPKPADFAYLAHVFDGGHLAGLYPTRDAISVGSGKADIRCPNDRAMSAEHARINRRGGSFFLRDLNSRTGTFIRVHHSVELFHGDVFLLGHTRFRFELS